MGRVAGQAHPATAASSSRCAACRATRSTATATRASARCSRLPARTSRSIEVVGKWDDGTAQKVTADAIAVHKKFDGIYVQGGSTGTVRALIDASHPLHPGRRRGRERLPQALRRAFRRMACCAPRPAPARPGRHRHQGRDRRAGRRGVPQSISLPLPFVEDPSFKEGENYYPDLSDNFFVGNAFPACGMNFTAQEIMAKTEGQSVDFELKRSGRGRRPAARFAEGGDGRRAGFPHGRGVEALRRRPCARGRRIDRPSAAASTPCSARTAPASRPSSRSWPASCSRTRAPWSSRAEPISVPQSRRRHRGRHRLHLPGAVAAPASERRRQHLHHRPAAALRAYRPARAAPHRRGGAGPRRRAATSTRWPASGSAAVAPADGRDRQGAGARSEDPDPRRGDLGADRGRRRQVFDVLRRLRAEGLAIVYISHRMHEIAELADDCSVFRNGRHVATFEARTKTDDAVVEMMIGREYKQRLPAEAADRPAPADRRCRDRATCRGTSRLKDITARGPTGRDRRSRRARRPGPARAPAGAVRRAARRQRRIEIDGRAGDAGQPAAPPSASASAWR